MIASQRMPALSPLDDDVVALMKELGFTATEAKVYLALLKHSPATGYDVATRADVPRSAIYAVLSRLEQIGLVNAVTDKPAKYVPLSPARLHRTLGARFSKNLDQLKTGLEKLVGRPREGITWTIHGYAQMLEQAEELIGRAKRAVFGSLWGREAVALAGPLTAAAAKGIDLTIFSFNPAPEPCESIDASFFSYDIDETELEQHWTHKIILVSDHGRALLGGAEVTDSNRAVITDEEALVEMALSNLILDITLLGQRQERDTSKIVTQLTKRFAPIEKLAGRARGKKN